MAAGRADDAAPGFDSVEWSRRKWVESGLPAPDHFAALSAVLLISARIGASLDAILREHKLNRTGYLLLTTLLLAKDHSMSMSRLGRQLIIHPATMTFTVNQLVKVGMVTCEPDLQDRRVALVMLTEKGVAAIVALNEKFSESLYGFDGVQDRLAITLTEVIRQTLLRMT